MAKFVADANPGAQEKALEAFRLLLQKEEVAAIDTRNITKVVIDKALAPGKPSVKKLASECVCLLFEKSDDIKPVFEGITDSIGHKNQKTAIAGVQAANELLKNYGPKRLDFLKPFYPSIERLAGSTALALKTEAMNFYKEAYKYMGEALRPFLTKLKKAQQDELDKAFIEASSQVVKPVRASVFKIDLGTVNSSPQSRPKGNLSAIGEMGEFDAYEMVDPVDIFKKFNENWSMKVLETAKWSDRKAMLEELLREATDAVKISNMPYQHIAEMQKRLMNDNNILVMITALKVYGVLAKGLRNNFYHIAKASTTTLLGKLKDKRGQIIDEAGKALDSYLYVIGFEDVVDNIKDALNDKTAEVKVHTMQWIERNFEKEKGKKGLNTTFKYISPVVTKLLNDGNGDVREVALKLLARFKAVLGENTVKKGYSDIPQQKLTKINDIAAGLMGTIPTALMNLAVKLALTPVLV